MLVWHLRRRWHLRCRRRRRRRRRRFGFASSSSSSASASSSLSAASSAAATAWSSLALVLFSNLALCSLRRHTTLISTFDTLLKNVEETKILTTVRKVRGWYIRKVYGTKSLAFLLSAGCPLAILSTDCSSSSIVHSYLLFCVGT